MQGIPLAVEIDQEDDGQLMQLVAKGDQRAFQRLMQRHLAKTVRLAARMLGNSDAADDAAQEAFIRVWKNAQKFESPDAAGAKFTTWLYRIVLNIVIDEKRKRKNVSIDDVVEPEDERDSALERMEKHERNVAFQKSIQALPHNQKWAIALCFFEDCSNKQAAEVMGLSVKAVESLLVRARKTLKLELSPQEAGHEHQ